MKLSVNAVKSYFKRNWKKEDMMNSGEIPLHAHKSLKKVYLTLFCAMLSSTFASYLHLIWEVGGLFTVLLSVACLLWLYFTSPWRVKKRVLLLMIAAFTVGASVGIFTKYLFQIDQRFIVIVLAATTIGFGTFWFGAMFTRQRSELYIGCLLESCATMYLLFVNACDIYDSHTAHWMLKVCLTLFCATLSSTFGSYLHLIGEAGGAVHSPFICSMFTLALLYIIMESESIPCLFSSFVVSLLAGTAIGYGTFCFGAKSTRERSTLYIGCLLDSYAFMYMWFVIAADMIFGGHTDHYMLKVFAVLSLFMVYFVINRQEIVYNALSEDVNFVNCTFTVFFNLPAIVVHVARLELIAVIEHYRQN